jgi:hypothetical protein
MGLRRCIHPHQADIRAPTDAACRCFDTGGFTGRRSIANWPSAPVSISPMIPAPEAIVPK